MEIAHVPLTPLRWLTAWSADGPMLTLVVLLGLAYLYGVRRAAGRGVSWQRSCTGWFFAAGLGSLVVATMSFLGTYDRVLMWPLATQDILLMTFVPVGLTLGRPIALFKAARPAPAGRAHPVRARLLRVLSFPLLGSLLAVTLLLLVYTTSWDLARLEQPALLQLTRVALLAAGCAFVWPLLGVDAGTGHTTYPVRAFLAFLDGLLDAIPGLAVLGSHGLIAGDYYAQVGRTWGPTLAQDQRLAGTAMVALSELVGLPTLLVLVIAWVRDDARQARQIDAMEQPVPVTAAGIEASDPLQQRPWWETDPGPLADRGERFGWGTAEPDQQ